MNRTSSAVNADASAHRPRLPLIRTATYLAMLSFLAIVLASKGITDEGTVSLQGDMPRHMMNGVYFYDLIREMPLNDPIEYTQRYFARYPALSLGHHPVLTALAQVPFYTLFGISVSSARWMIIFFAVIAVVAWFFLTRSIYSERVAFLSSLLFVTSPFIVHFSRVVMTEIPALALVLVSAYFYWRFLQSADKKYMIAFVLSFVLSCYAKQFAIFILPVFVLYLAIRKGAKTLLQKDVIFALAAIGILLVPLVVMTFRFSPTNVGFVADQSVSQKLQASSLLYYPRVLWKQHVGLPVAALSLLSIGVALFRREMRSVFFLLWIMAVYGMVLYLGLRLPRLAIYWIPPFCLFAALSIEVLQARLWKVSLTGAVTVAVVLQFARAYAAEPEYALGYEEAAVHVVEHRRGPTTMFSSIVDTGYFVFFLRKHDPLQQIAVLRADKLLVTSKLDRIVEERIMETADIYRILNDFGTCYVVLEDAPYESQPLEWLREEVKKDKFVLRRRIPIRSQNRGLQDMVIGIYEYKECGPPDPDAILDLKIPLSGDSIQLKLTDIISE